MAMTDQHPPDEPDGPGTERDDEPAPPDAPVQDEPKRAEADEDRNP
jgi:hypothetical protein